MKFDTSKLIQQAKNNTTKIDLSKIANTKEETPKKRNFNLSFDGLDDGSPKIEKRSIERKSNKINLFNLHAEEIKEQKEKTNEQKGFSFTFTDNKVYSLDTIIRNKRRNNSNCPLILKVNLENENDREITELITIMIIDNYLNAEKPEEEQMSTEYIKENMDTLIPQVPNFDIVFDEYFNKYYTYYYKQIQTREFKEGSISLDAIKNNIVDSYNGSYDNILGQELDEYANVLAFNKPMVEYEMGSEPDYDDGDDDTYLDLIEKDNTLYIKNSGGIIPNQTGVNFPTINGEKILNNKNDIQLLTLSDYIELMQTTILLSGDSDMGLGFTTEDGSCITVQEEK